MGATTTSLNRIAASKGRRAPKASGETPRNLVTNAVAESSLLKARGCDKRRDRRRESRVHSITG